MKRIILLLSVFTASCSQEYPEFNAIDRLTQTFYQEAEARGFHLEPVKVKLMPGLSMFDNTIGVSTHRDKVWLDREWVNDQIRTGNYHRIEPILLHEFGHELLRRSHTETRSVMNAEWITGGRTFETEGRIDSVKRKAFIDELFTN